MRFLAVVCLIAAPSMAWADDKSAPDSDRVEWGVGAGVRRSHVSVGLQKLFVDDSPGPATQDGGGITFVRRSKSLEIDIGFGYDPIHGTEGYYLDKGGDPMGIDDVDFVEFDKELSWFMADVTFVGHAQLHKILGLRFGAGLGLGLVRGHAYRTSALCTSDRLQQDCDLNPDGARQREAVNVPVLPVLNVLAGIELRPIRQIAISADVGLHTAPYVGVSLTLYLWKS